MDAPPDPTTKPLTTLLADASLLRVIADAASPLLAYYEISTLRCRFANRPYASHYGWDADDILGRTVREVVGEAAWEVIEPCLDLTRVGQDVHYERAQTLPDGGQRLIRVDMLTHFDASLALRGLFVQIGDATGQRRAQALIRQSEGRMRKFAQATDEAIVFHVKGLITGGNEALERLLGYGVAEVLGRSVMDLMSDETRHTVFKSIRSDREKRRFSYECSSDWRLRQLRHLGPMCASPCAADATAAGPRGRRTGAGLCRPRCVDRPGRGGSSA